MTTAAHEDLANAPTGVAPGAALLHRLRGSGLAGAVGGVPPSGGVIPVEAQCCGVVAQVAGTAAAVMCIDAMQFAEPLSAGCAEAYRILRPGGRLVLTGWQALDAHDEVVSARLRQDIGAAMAGAGFVDVAVTDMPGWKTAERALWEAAVALDPPPTRRWRRCVTKANGCCRRSITNGASSRLAAVRTRHSAPQALALPT